MRRRGALASLLALGLCVPARRAAASEELSPESPRLQIPAGRSLISVRFPDDAYATLAIVGPPHALLGLQPIGGPLAARLRSRDPLDEDGLLPRTLSVLTGPPSERGASQIELFVDVTDPVEAALVWAPASDDREPTPRGLKDGSEQARALVGFPVPRSSKDGYMIASAARYVFARIDVVKSLQVSFEKARRKYNGDPIAISDASQWDGKRPKSDVSQVRHISHEGGCDVDIAFPANDTVPSTLRDHCRGVRLENDRFGCSPGTARGVDFERLAYLLGTLADEAPGRITKVFLDDVYRRELVRVAPALHERKFIKEAGLLALGEDGVLVASPWHTDHLHVRFAGEKARSLL